MTEARQTRKRGCKRLLLHHFDGYAEDRIGGSGSRRDQPFKPFASQPSLCGYSFLVRDCLAAGKWCFHDWLASERMRAVRVLPR